MCCVQLAKTMKFRTIPCDSLFYSPSLTLCKVHPWKFVQHIPLSVLLSIQKHNNRMHCTFFEWLHLYVCSATQAKFTLCTSIIQFIWCSLNIVQCSSTFIHLCYCYSVCDLWHISHVLHF